MLCTNGICAIYASWILEATGSYITNDGGCAILILLWRGFKEGIWVYIKIFCFVLGQHLVHWRREQRDQFERQTINNTMWVSCIC